MKNKGIVIVSSVLAIAGAYFIYRYFSKDKIREVAAEKPPVGGPDIISEEILRKGSKGAKVRRLQGLLLKIDPNSLPKYGIDGDFGSETEAAVLKILGKTVVADSDMAELEKRALRAKFPYVAAPASTSQPKPLFLADLGK
jgi:peptidoglycan hydrolase-like protein with peptidoglycan-binding domain